MATTGYAPKSKVSVSMGMNSRTLSLAVEEDGRDELDAIGSGRGVSKIERHHDYFKEMEVSFVKKSSRASFTNGGKSVHFVEPSPIAPSMERINRRYSMPMPSLTADGKFSLKGGGTNVQQKS